MPQTGAQGSHSDHVVLQVVMVLLVSAATMFLLAYFDLPIAHPWDGHGLTAP